MKVIALHGEVHHLEAVLAGGAQSGLDGGEDPRSAQGWEPFARPQRHVGGASRLVGRATRMGDPALTFRALSTGALPPTSPGAWHLQIELLWHWRVLINMSFTRIVSMGEFVR
jgi:hypothetical protein